MFMEKMDEVLAKSRLKKVIISSFGDVLPTVKKWLFKMFAGSKVSKTPSSNAYIDYNTLIDNEGDFKTHPVDLDEIAVLQYTGGTTGVPKGAMLTHKNISSSMEQSIAWDPDTTKTSRGNVLAVLPFFHVYGMTVINCITTALGGRLVILPKFDADEVIGVFKRTEINMLPVVPTMYTALINAKGFKDIDLSKVTGSLSGGAPLPKELKTKFEKYLPNGLRIQEGYGLTETSPGAMGNPKWGKQKLGSIGLPIPGTTVYFTDIDDPEKILPYGETGEICLKGPQVMAGYWKKPEATAETLVNGGLRTGDIGYMDEDGYTFIVDRKKDMVLVGGFNVYPRTIEEVLFKHEDIVEAMVIGIPDEYLGEAPKAFVVLVKGKNLSEDDVLDYLKPQIGKHEMPKYVEFRDDLPKTAVGKLSKKDLIEEERLKGLA
jgi:long-chain acyl-CoA synthetase